MGWYIALACAGALDPMGGMQVGQHHGNADAGTDDRWATYLSPSLTRTGKEIPNQRENLMREVFAINARPDHVLGLSIDLGGMLVLAGNEAGLAAFENSAPSPSREIPDAPAKPCRLSHPPAKTCFQSSDLRALPEHLFDPTEHTRW